VIDLRCCDVAEVLGDPALSKAAALVFADPPWAEYVNNPGDASPAGKYPVLRLPDIVQHLRDAYHCAAPGARLLLWCTWPLLRDWMTCTTFDRSWQYVTGGSWHKLDTCGVGYHWRGQSEPVLVYKRPGSCGRPSLPILNAYQSRPTQHSEKPVEWLQQMIEAWTSPGDLVLDLYAGMAPVARACKATGRDYIGAEIDPERHRHAMAKLDGTPYHPDARQRSLFG